MAPARFKRKVIEVLKRRRFSHATQTWSALKRKGCLEETISVNERREENTTTILFFDRELEAVCELAV
jgi:hypothetical protein